MQINDKVRVVSQCLDKNRTGVLVEVHTSLRALTHQVRLDDPTNLDRSYFNFMGTDLIPFMESELEVI